MHDTARKPVNGYGQSDAPSSTAGPPDNMTKWGPKLSEEELARIAGLSVPELADMLRNGDTLHAYAALRQLKADGGAKRNLDLLLGIAAETRGDMIVQNLVQPVEASAGDEEKRAVDKLLDLLEAELAKERPSVSPADAARSIAGAVYKELHSPVVYRRRDADEIDRLMAVPYEFDRAVALLVSCLDSEDREARLTAARWLGYVGGTDPGAVAEIAARLRAWRVAEVARAERLEEEDRRASAARASERVFEEALRETQRRLETREGLLDPQRLADGGAAVVAPERAAMEALWEGNLPEPVLRRRLVSLRRDLQRLEEGGRHGEADGLMPEIESLRRRLEGDAFSETDFSFEWKVRQARRYDPKWSRDRDRERAVALYREALALRPGDTRNIEVEHRIAALYAFHADREVGVRPDPAKAAEVFAHTIETCPPTQERWVHSHFGMAATGVMQDGLGGALHWYWKVLEDVDPEAMEAPLGKEVWGADRPDQAQRERAVEAAARAPLRAVERIAYVAGAMGPDEQAKQLSDIAARYRGTPVGDRAAELLRATLNPGLEAIAERAADGLLPDLELTAAGPVVAETAPVGRPAPAERPGGTPQPRPPVPAGTREAGDRSPWRACGVGAGAAALVACALLLARRRRRRA